MRCYTLGLVLCGLSLVPFVRSSVPFFSFFFFQFQIPWLKKKWYLHYFVVGSHVFTARIFENKRK